MLFKKKEKIIECLEPPLMNINTKKEDDMSSQLCKSCRNKGTGCYNSPNTCCDEYYPMPTITQENKEQYKIRDDTNMSYLFSKFSTKEGVKKGDIDTILKTILEIVGINIRDILEESTSMAKIYWNNWIEEQAKLNKEDNMDKLTITVDFNNLNTNEKKQLMDLLEKSKQEQKAKDFDILENDEYYYWWD